MAVDREIPKRGIAATKRVWFRENLVASGDDWARCADEAAGLPLRIHEVNPKGEGQGWPESSKRRFGFT
ncbi:MAG: hypothetical protein HQL51_13340 [Magnetococcales bacterium]|nr:hypothetical protein [Magnetococcales bacterium]